jgi:hypothetical protein
MNANIFQIYYSDHTKKIIDPLFIPLDNLQNERPDWREYWPIRNYLLSNELEANTLYGFFSPKFSQKTKIDGSQVLDFVSGLNSDVDFVNFSPYYDQAAFFQNVFEQAYATHKSGYDNIFKSFSFIFPDIKISDLVNTSLDTVYCNYFCANKYFWTDWLAICERIFLLAENIESPLYECLNENIAYGDESLPFKIFLIERVASVILATKKYSIEKYQNIEKDTYCGTIFTPDKHHDSLMKMDAYKTAYLKTNNDRYMLFFSDERQAIL